MITTKNNYIIGPKKYLADFKENEKIFVGITSEDLSGGLGALKKILIEYGGNEPLVNPFLPVTKIKRRMKIDLDLSALLSQSEKSLERTLGTFLTIIIMAIMKYPEQEKLKLKNISLAMNIIYH